MPSSSAIVTSAWAWPARHDASASSPPSAGSATSVSASGDSTHVTMPCCIIMKSFGATAPSHTTITDLTSACTSRITHVLSSCTSASGSAPTSVCRLWLSAEPDSVLYVEHISAGTS